MTVTAHRYRPSVGARVHAAAVHWDPETGERRTPTRTSLTAARLNGALLSCIPGNTYYTTALGGYGRLTNLYVSLGIAVFATIVAGLAVIVVAAEVPLPLSTVASVIAGVSAATVILTANPLVRARRIASRDATHLLSDVTRAPDAPPGTGADTIRVLRTLQGYRIVGTANNPDLWAKVYEPQADLLAVDRRGRYHFELKT